MRNRLRLVLTGAGVTLAMGATQPAAQAAATVQTYHFAGSFSGQGTNPCTGEPGTLTFTFDQAVYHSTTTPNGTTQQTSTQTGSATFTPDGAAQPTYTGHFTDTTNTLEATLTDGFGGHLDLHKAQNQPPVVHCSRP